MTVTATTFDAMAVFQSDLIRKGLQGAVFAALSTATAVTQLTTGASGDLAALPTGYIHLGLLDKGNGVDFTRKPNTSDVTSWGFVEPTRKDITKDDKTLKFTAQETKLITLQMYEGVDLSAATPDSTTGEISIVAPVRPATIYYRVLVLWVDGSGTNTCYVGKFYPRMIVTDLDDQKVTDGDAPVEYGITMSALTDSTLGYPSKNLYGGPGWKSRLVAMGFPAAS